MYYASYAINVTYYCYRVMPRDCTAAYGSFGCYKWMRSQGQLQDMGAYLAPFLAAEGEGRGPGGAEGGGGGGPAALQGKDKGGGGGRSMPIGLLAGLLGGGSTAATGHTRCCPR